jgi:hypothetical protein
MVAEGVCSVKNILVYVSLGLVLDRGSPIYRNLAPRGSRTRVLGTLGQMLSRRVEQTWFAVVYFPRLFANKY